MPDQAKDSKSPAPDAKPKQEGTVLLTAAELRAISGGAAVSNPTPVNSTPNNTKVSGS
jgi:hypothetical protein